MGCGCWRGLNGAACGVKGFGERRLQGFLEQVEVVCLRRWKDIVPLETVRLKVVCQPLHLGAPGLPDLLFLYHYFLSVATQKECRERTALAGSLFPFDSPPPLAGVRPTTPCFSKQ